MRESEIQKQILDWLKAGCILHWRVNLGGVRRSGIGKTKNPMRGFPDIAGIMPTGVGRLFVIEVKTTTGTLSEEQKRWREVLVAKGVFYILARSVADVAVLETGLWP